MKRLIIFDYDGTLADTSPGICHCYNKTASEMGYTPHSARDNFYGVIGVPGAWVFNSVAHYAYRTGH